MSASKGGRRPGGVEPERGVKRGGTMGGRGGGDIERQRPRQGARDRRMDEPSEESAGGRRGRGRGRRRRGARPAPDASASAGRPARAPSRDSGPEYEYYEHDSVMPVHGRGHVRGEADDGVEFPQPLAADTAGAPVPHRSHAASIGGNGPDELADAEIGANARLQGGREALAGAPLSTAPAGAVGDGDFAAMWSNMLGHRGGGAPVSGAAPARPSTASRVLREAPQSPPAAAAPEPPEASPLAQSPRAAGPSSGQGSPRTARRAGGGKGPDLRQALRRERAARAEAERRADSLGRDLEAARAEVERLMQADEDSVRLRARMERMAATAAAEHSEEVQALRDELESMRELNRTLSSRLSRVEGAVVDDAARSQVYKDLLLESRRQAISVHACKEPMERSLRLADEAVQRVRSALQSVPASDMQPGGLRTPRRKAGMWPGPDAEGEEPGEGFEEEEEAEEEAVDTSYRDPYGRGRAHNAGRARYSAKYGGNGAGGGGRGQSSAPRIPAPTVRGPRPQAGRGAQRQQPRARDASPPRPR